MPLELAPFLNSLIPSNPAPGDAIPQGDDHIRLIKAALLATFPALAGAVNLSHDQINALPALALSLASAAAQSEATARDAAVQAEASARNTAVQTEASARNTAVQAEASTRLAGDQNEANARYTSDVGLSGRIDTEINQRAAGDANLANAINSKNPLLVFGNNNNGTFWLKMPVAGANMAIAAGYVGLSDANDQAVELGFPFNGIFGMGGFSTSPGTFINLLARYTPNDGSPYHSARAWAFDTNGNIAANTGFYFIALGGYA